MRISWVDCCKGLAMIMVVLGHCGENQYLFKGLYYIHLPLFIILSGFWLDNSKYYSNEYSMKRFAMKKLKELMYPYLIFGVMAIALQYLRLALFGVNFDYGGVNGLLFNILHLENYANWFLPMLFGAEVLCMMFFKLFHKYNRRDLFLFILMIICVYISSIIPKVLPHVTVRSFAFLLFTFGKIITFSFFIFLGYFVKIFIEKYNTKLKSFRFILAPFMIISAMLSLIIASNLTMVDLHTLHWESAKIYFVIACSGGVSIILAFYTLNISNKLLSHIGKNSLIINGTHLNLMIVSCVVQLSFFSCPKVASLYNWGPLFVTVGVLLIEIVFIIPVMQRTYPFLCNYKLLTTKLRV